ncbi:hypothetical protein AAD018_013370 [Aestuariibius insulae]|uniref:hypothetical protein n=1 Tax=Aestuariibius insulae TaxID=2058287 RepID=UPI00345F142F
MPWIAFPAPGVMLIGLALVAAAAPVAALVVRKTLRPQIELPFGQILQITAISLAVWMATPMVFAPVLLAITGLARSLSAVMVGAPLGLLFYLLVFRYLIRPHVPARARSGRAAIWSAAAALGVLAGLLVLFSVILSPGYRGL